MTAHSRAQADALPAATADDISLRWVEAILAVDQSRHPSPLTVDRPPGQRVQGCCRDHSLLAVAVLRHHGIPARSRVGFAGYLSGTGWHHDHVVAEAWVDGRWRRFDPEFADATAAVGTLRDTSDIPAGPTSPFLTAAHVWRGHRSGVLDVDRFGVAEDVPIAGDWFVHSYVIQEVAHRFGDELLLWDQWGAVTTL